MFEYRRTVFPTLNASIAPSARPGSRVAHESGARAATDTVVAILALLAGNLYFLDWSRHVGVEALGRENGPLEMLQLALLVPTVALFGLSHRYGTGAVKVAGGLLATFTAAAFVREFELPSLAARFSVLGLSNDNLQEALLLMLTVAGVAYAFSQRGQFLGLVRLGLRRAAWPIYAAGVPLAACVLLDGRLVTGVEMRFWEELIEYNGYLLLLLAAWRHAGLIGESLYSTEALQTM